MSSSTFKPSLPRMIKLHDYQWDAVCYLSGWAQQGHRLLGLTAPTGSGKTYILSALLLKLGRLFKGVVLATPSIQTESNFHKSRRFTANPKHKVHDDGIACGSCFSTSVLNLTLIAKDVFLRPRQTTQDKDETFRTVVSGDIEEGPWTLLTTNAWLVQRPKDGETWKDKLPKRLDGILLVLDEGHHAAMGDDTERVNREIGKLATEWYARGGAVLWVTATPFRPDKKTVFPIGTKAFIWPLAKHAAGGFAPNNFKIRTIPFTSLGETAFEELSGDQLTLEEAERGTSYQTMVDQWVLDGMPKAVFIVPAQGSTHWAEGLLTALETALKAHPDKGRVVNAVGTDARAENALNDALFGSKNKKGERSGGEQDQCDYDSSKVAVILACKRFDEGTDWPFCSHVYCYGISSSFALIIQRWGRTFRDKRNIKGYPVEHLDSAVITFFIPRVKPEVVAQFKKQHHDHAFLLACYMADYETGKDIASEIRIRWEKHWDRRPAQNSWTRVKREQEIEIPDHVRAEMNTIITQFRLDFLMQTRGQAPTQEQEQEYLDSQDLNEEQRHAADHIIFERVAEQHPEVLSNLERQMDTLGTVSRSSIRKMYREVIAPYQDQTYFSEVDDRVIGFFSDFTGQDAGSVASSLAGNKDLVISDEALVDRVIRPYVANRRRPLTGAEDLTSFLGGTTPTSTLDVERMLSRRGLDIRRLAFCERAGWVATTDIDIDLIREKLKPYQRRLSNRVRTASETRHWEDVSMLRRALRDSQFWLKDFGIKENLVGLAMAAHFGWRGLSKGKTLEETLWPRVQTPTLSA